MVDDALLVLGQGSVSRVVVMVDSSADVPSWKVLPYECQDDFNKSMLPACVAAGLIQWSNDTECRLHDPLRWRLQTHGTLRDMFDILPAWTCPIVKWEITTQTSVVESLSVFSQELRKVWDEISRIFALSIVVRPRGVRIAYHVEGLGTLSLGAIKRTRVYHVPLLANLIFLQRVTPSSTACGPTSTTRMTTSWPTWLTFFLALCHANQASAFD